MKIIWQVCIVLVASQLLLASHAVRAQQSLSPDQSDALKQLHSDVVVIEEAYSNAPAIHRFQQRLARLEELVGLLVSGSDAAQTASLEAMLGDIAGFAPASVELSTSTFALGAAEILAEYQPFFEEGLPTPPIVPGQLRILRDYYHARIEDAQKRVTERGHLAGAVSEASRIEALELSIVIPLLHVSDSRWSTQEIEDLPEWMRRQDSLVVLENFALRLRRPQTAYQFAYYRRSLSNQDKSQKTDYLGYLQDVAKQLAEQRDYHAALYCFQTAIPLAEKGNDHLLAHELRLELADLYTDAGHPQLGAETLKAVVENGKTDEMAGKAAMLRLKYLYESQQYEQVVREAAVYQEQERYQLYLPQILYIAWVSARRENQTDKAQQLQQEFLEKYSTHPLGADIYFSEAMKYLAASDYVEALRLLEVIEYRYPKSRLIDRVKQIQVRIEKAVGNDTSRVQ